MEEQKICQSNELTEARHEMSALEKNILYLLMCELKEDDVPQKEYCIDIAHSEFLKNVRIEDLRQAARNLLSRVYYIKKPNGNILAVTLMTVARYDQSEGKMRIRISQKLLPYLIILRDNFTELQLQVALGLKSKYSKRIYEMISQHKETRGFSISVEELKWRLALQDPQKGVDQYPNWTSFQKAVLSRSQKELRQKSDITFTYEAIKTGRKYTHLNFKIQKNPSREEIKPLKGRGDKPKQIDMFSLSSREKAAGEEISHRKKYLID